MRAEAAPAASGRTLPRARTAVYLYFFIFGLGFAVWVARIPAVKHGLGLTDGTLGLALLALPAGTVAAMPLSGWLVDRYGSGTVTRLAGVLVGGTLVGPGLARDLPQLIGVLLVLGVALSVMDVAMNAHGVRVERAYGRPLLSSFHASYSVAGLAGAVIGGLFARAGVSLLTMLVCTAVPLVAASWLAGRGLLPDPPPRTGRGAEPEPGADRAADPGENRAADPAGPAPGPAAAPVPARRATLVVLLLGFLGVCGALGEGAAADWSAVYLHDELGSSPGFAPAGFAAFSVAMAAGRLLGDGLALRFGPVPLVRGCGLLAAAGLGIVLAGGTELAAVAGFGLMGAGLSCVIPQLFAAAGRADPARAGRAISWVAGISYTGLVGGPALIGVLAEWVGLPVALGLPLLLALVISVAAGVLAPAGRA